MLPSPSPLIAVTNHSKHVSSTDAWNAAWGVAYQLRWQAGPLLKIAADLTFIEPGKPVPAGAWVLDLVDQLPEAPEAAGYHDEDGNEVPYGRIGVEPSLDAGLPISEVLSHEALELLFDPHVNLTAFDPASDRLYAAELCDPVQGGTYDLGAPYGRTTGLKMSDFILQSWLDPNTPTDQPTSYRGTVKGPFSLAHGGYVSYTTTLPPNWQQQMAEGVNEAWVHDKDDRVVRRTTGRA